jgi:hypothetical protein
MSERSAPALQGAARIARMRERLKALKALLREAGIAEPVTEERLGHLRRMLPADAVRFLGLRRAFELFRPYTPDPPDREPTWMAEPPDPAVLEELRQVVSPAVLAIAWNDRWVTAATVAEALGISRSAARRILVQLPHREVPNPHYRQAAPMRLVRMSDVAAWAEANRDLLDAWRRRRAARKPSRPRGVVGVCLMRLPFRVLVAAVGWDGRLRGYDEIPLQRMEGWSGERQEDHLWDVAADVVRFARRQRSVIALEAGLRKAFARKQTRRIYDLLCSRILELARQQGIEAIRVRPPRTAVVRIPAPETPEDREPEDWEQAYLVALRAMGKEADFERLRREAQERQAEWDQTWDEEEWWW